MLSAANTGLSGTVSNVGNGVLRLTNSSALGSVSTVSLDNTTTAGGLGTALELQNNITIGSGTAISIERQRRLPLGRPQLQR